MKLCIIYNFAPKYREGIFSLLEKQYTCHWVFGQNKTDIKGMDLSQLSDVEQIETLALFRNFTYQKGWFRLLRSYDHLIILGELYSLSTWLILLMRRCFFRKKHIYLWSHGWYGREGIIKRFLKRLFFGLSDTVFLYGNYAKTIAFSQGYSLQNLHVIHNSLDYETQLRIRNSLQPSDIYRKHFANNHPTLIFIGRLTEVKRLDILIEAVSKLKLMGKTYNIVFVGDGSQRSRLESLVRQKELEATTWFYGNSYDEQQNAPLIFNADICVSPGNVGLTAIHSMVYGTPVITHDNFPYQMPEYEAIQVGKTGNFFHYNDSDHLANCISQWFESPDYDRTAIRKACYREIDLYWTPAFQLDIIKRTIDSDTE